MSNEEWHKIWQREMRARLGNLWSWRDHHVPSGRTVSQEPVQAWDPPTSDTDASRGRGPVCITMSTTTEVAVSPWGQARDPLTARRAEAELEIHSLSRRACHLGARPCERGVILPSGRGAEEEKKRKGPHLCHGRPPAAREGLKRDGGTGGNHSLPWVAF
jgi:hypothetical protein